MSSEHAVKRIDEFDHAVSVGGKKIGKVYAWASSGYGAKLKGGMSMSPKFETVEDAAAWLVGQFDKWTADKAMLTKQIGRSK